MISVIVPFYNSEKHIKKCISSVLSNTYKDIEIICVDDGSKDNSLSIVESMSETDKRIKVFFQQNKGVSSARNLGLNYATGKYVCFIDSDDLIRENYFIDFINEFETKKIDLCICGYETLQNKCTSKTHFMNLDDNILSKEELLDGVFHHLGGFVWNKMFDLEIIKKNNIEFNEKILYCEDLVFLIDYIMNISRGSSVIPSLNYIYYAPMLGKYNLEAQKSRLFAIETIIDTIRKCENCDALKDNLKVEYIVKCNNLKIQKKFLYIKKHPTYIFSLLKSDFNIKFKLYHIIKFILSI